MSEHQAAMAVGPISESEYLEAETAYLVRRLNDGDRGAAATSAATLQRILHQLMLDLDPDEKAVGRVATSNGRYYRWPFLND